MVAVAVAVVTLLETVVVEPNECELDSPELPALEDDDILLGLRVLLYLEPGYPGRVGSSSMLDFFDSITTTRRMSGRNCGSDWVHNSPIFTHTAT